MEFPRRAGAISGIICGALPYACQLRTDELACGLAPGQRSRMDFVTAWELNPAEIDELLHRGYIFIGTMPGRFICRRCARCLPLRLPLESFRPSRSQRRTWQQRHRIVVREGPPVIDAERYEIYRQHARRFPEEEVFPMELWSNVLRDHLGCLTALEYLVDGQLLGYSFMIVGEDSAFAAQHVWLPEAAPLRLGVLSMLYEIEWSRRAGKGLLYLGMTNPGTRIDYLRWFRPNEYSPAEGVWLPYSDALGQVSAQARNATHARGPGVRDREGRPLRTFPQGTPQEVLQAHVREAIRGD